MKLKKLAVDNKYLLPFINTTVFLTMIILSTRNSIYWEIQKIILISIAIWLIWFCLYIFEIKKEKYIVQNNFNIIVKFIISLLISLYFVNAIWFSGYLTINPINAIIEGTVHVDTLYHATISESIANYGFPSILLNNSSFLNYHFGSHLIFAVLSDVLNIPVFFFYNYLFPIIFIPIYSFLIISVIIEIRKFKKLNTQINAIDYLLLSFFLLGFLPTEILDKIGIWKSSEIISESYLLALITFLLYVIIFLKLISNNKPYRNILIIITTILFIFICTSMKISIGFLFTIGVVYINFRNNTYNIKYWFINFMFIIIYCISHYIFSYSSSSELIEIKLFSFVRNFTNFGYHKGILGFILHYLYLFMFAIFLVSYIFKNLTFNEIKNNIISKYYLTEETLIIISLISIIPGLLLNLGGGAEAYFSYFPGLIAFCIILGYDIPSIIKSKLLSKNIFIKHTLYIFILLLFIINVDNSKTILSYYRVIRKQEISSNSNVIENLRNIINISKINKKDVWIFLDDNADVFNYFINNAKASVFFYPALTGVKVINGLYTNGVDIFSTNGSFVQSINDASYGINKKIIAEYIDDIPHYVDKLSLDQAIEKAKINGLKNIIFIHDNSYRIIEL